MQKLEKEAIVKNAERKLMNLKPIVVAKRKCLKCDKMFKSVGPQHRLCGCSHNRVYINE